MKSLQRALATAAACVLPMGTAMAEDVKIGLVATLSGAPAALGLHMRDGFMPAAKELGGQNTEVIVVDDELKPDVAVQKAKALIERDKVHMVVGVVFSNVMMAISKPVLESKTFLISGNAGPSPLAGKGCSPFFFSTSWQNDQNHEVMDWHPSFAGKSGWRSPRSSGKVIRS